MGDIPYYKIKPVHEAYDDDAVRAIGEFFLECSSAEVVLTFVLAELQNHPNQATLNGLAVITGMQNKVMLEKISTCLSILAPKHHAELDALCQKIRGLFEHRNNIAHSTALLGSGKKIVVVPIKLRPPVTLKEIVYHPKQLREFAARLPQLIRHLTERMKQIGVVRTPKYSLPKLLGQEDPQPPASQPTPTDN